jgi:catechol 2,3-dioxygenase-like lactoylglutathione lyase family enzyme
MARIRHIALTTDNPAQTAEFYKTFFGLTELYRQPKDSGANGVWLSDGYIYFAILKYGDADVPKLGPGHTSELRGLHHLGFEVSDQQATVDTLNEAHVPPVPEFVDPLVRPMVEHSRALNLKFLGPDAVQLDVRERGWNEAIASHMQLYELTPVTSTARSK